MPSRQSIAVIGSGISGLSAAWLLSQRHDVQVFEREPRAGGHSNTVDATCGVGGCVPVDTGFIVYNQASYPNLVAMFDHLGVPTAPTSMSFAVSLDAGRYEYSGSGIAGLFGQPSNLVRPDHWRMAADVLRFFREAPALLDDDPTLEASLGEYLASNGYSRAFVDNHVLPMAAAIWSTPSAQVMDFPVASFVRFFANHGLLQVRNQPIWRTVVGGSREYVRRLLADMSGRVALAAPALRIERTGSGVVVEHRGGREPFDACVIATHADEALGLLSEPSSDERRLLGAFGYTNNHAVLHRDRSFMPRRRRLWSSWNYLGAGSARDRQLSLSYWMNRLQPLGEQCENVFVTLNPARTIPLEQVIAVADYSHPVFDRAAMAAQRELWQLQGRQRTWFCGSYFGYGFHEDGLQAGLAVAEDIGGVRRPWRVPGESGRIHVSPARSGGGVEPLENAI